MTFRPGSRLLRACPPILLLLTPFLALWPAPAHAQTPQWTSRFGTARDEEVYAVATALGAVYAAGDTFGALTAQPNAGARDAFLRRLDTAGNEVWTRQFGTIVTDLLRGAAADAGGVYVVGSTNGVIGQSSLGDTDAFVRKYDPDGNVLWTRQFGTSGADAALGIAADATGVYVVGQVRGTLPGQTNPSLNDDAFVRKYDANGNEVWTRQFGTVDQEQAYGVAVDVSGIYITGRTGGSLAQPAQGTDAFLRKYDANGTAVWTRQFGGASADYGNAVAVGPSGVYVAGETTGLPGQTKVGGLFDAFVAKYDLAGAQQWVRQFGSASEDASYGVAVSSNVVNVVGFVEGALPGQTALGALDGFLRRYDFNGTEVTTLQFGTTGSDVAYGVIPDVYVGGYFSGNAPNQTPLGGSDAFVLKILNPPDVTEGGVVNNASFALSPAPVAPGSIAAVFGTNLTDGAVVLNSSFGQDNKLVTTLGGTTVTINDISAPMFYATPTQLGIQIPFELAGQTSAAIRVTVAGQTSVPRNVVLDSVAPGIFTATANGQGQAALAHQDGITPVTAQNPAKPNEVVVFFGTGLGSFTPPLATGEPSATGNPTTLFPEVTINGLTAEILFSGAAPFFVGLNQLNVRVPPTTPTGANIPIVLTIGGKQANAVTIPVAP